MGIGKINNFKSETIEYSTPISIVAPLIKEFNLKKDVCASKENHKLSDYWTKGDNSLNKEWIMNCWMNPPFNRSLQKWVRKAHTESLKHNNTIVCLIPVRSNTKWWYETMKDSEIRFINGEVNFNNLERGLWLPMCIVIFGKQARKGKFGFINYRTTAVMQNA